MNYGYYYEIREIDWWSKRFYRGVEYVVVRYLAIRGQPEPIVIGSRYFEGLDGAKRYVREMEQKDEEERCISERARDVGRT